MIARALVVILLLFTVQNSHAVIEQVEFDNPQLEERYRSLIDELRCLVCQNQNLAGSDAPLAQDLRSITADMLRNGATDAEIKTFMRERYGDFVLYRPPFNLSTAFLWLGPIVVLLIVLVALFMNIRRRQATEMLKPAHADDEAQRIKIQNLLRDASRLESDDN